MFLCTGGLTDPEKTDFEHLGEDRRYHKYFPDFVLFRKTGEFIEGKAEQDRKDNILEKKALEQLQNMQADKFKHQVLYAATSTTAVGELKPTLNWMNPGDS